MCTVHIHTVVPVSYPERTLARHGAPESIGREAQIWTQLGEQLVSAWLLGNSLPARAR